MSNTERNEAIAIVEEMVTMGYHLFGETPAQMVDRMGFAPAVWAMFRDRFKRNIEDRA